MHVLCKEVINWYLLSTRLKFDWLYFGVSSTATLLPIIVQFDSISSNPIDEGDKLALHCGAIGEPIPDISFQHDRIPIVANPPLLTITSGKISATLKIQSVEAGDAGTYRCTASNIVGTMYSEILVEVNLEKSTCKRFDIN